MDLGGLSPRQREAVTHPEGPLLILAGAGSGKTRVLTYRMAWLLDSGVCEPWRLLAMTFTNKAAGEMRDRVESLLGGSARPRMGTFHSVCAWLLRREAGRIGISERFTIYDSEDQRTTIKRLIKAGGNPASLTPSSTSSWISLRKNRGVTPEEALESASGTRESRLAELYALYDRRLRESDALDFDDLLTVTLRALRQYPDIRRAYSERWHHVLVDEYQDTCRVQHELLRELASHGRVTVVGDDDQSIYSWRGARVENMLGFERDFPGTTMVRLEENYRSTGSILKGASTLVANNSRRHAKTLWTRRPEGDPVRVVAVSDEEEEAAVVISGAADILERTGGDGTVAVLYRTNRQSRPLETECRRRGLRYEVVGAQRFYERAEVKDVIAYLRLVVNPADRVSLERVLNRPSRGVGRASRERFLSALDAGGADPAGLMLDAGDVPGLSGRAVSGLVSLGEWLSAARLAEEAGAPALEILDGLLEAVPITGMYDPEDPGDQSRLENLDELRSSVSRYDEDVPGGGLVGFLNDASLLTSVDEYEGEGTGSVALMTLHCAKGLEFDHVYVTGLEEGMLPFVRPGEHQPFDMEEERRLLYVGMTRARESLTLTWAAGRRRPGVRLGGPSRFIHEMAAGLERPMGPEREPRVPAAGTGREGDRHRTDYARGNLVRHPRYGRGIVVRADRRGEEWQLTVDFGFDEPKTLLTGYVPIPVLKRRGGPDDLD